MNKDIENLKNILVDLEDAENGAIINLSQEEINSLKTILNLIEKQQKEIEELHKEINQRIKLKIENEKCADRDFIYKGKIREKIKEARKINWHTPKLVIEYFEELLEEK